MTLQCGSGLQYPNFERGTGGCLVRFIDAPDRVLLLTAGHVVLPSYAKQNDTINAVDPPDLVLGTLRTWTNFQDSPTADAALIWVDPALVDVAIIGLGVPAQFNNAPQIDDRLRLIPGIGSSTPRETYIRNVGPAEMNIPAWNTTLTYADQLLCEPLVTTSGDSGAIVLDDENNVVGMVVGGSASTNQTCITPISAILNNSAWRGGQLQLLQSIPTGAVAPSGLPAASIPSQFGSLVTGGFFSGTPNDLSVPRSIRTNNPGALNFTKWQTARPGYVGMTESDGTTNSNRTTIYRTPEHGVGSWFHLLSNIYGFGTTESFSLLQLAQHYAGVDSGSAVDAYVRGWSSASGGTISAAATIDLADDDAVLNLARAMFQHEAGKPSPVHDEQITFGFQRERAGLLPK
jgi:hypothetical protein